jgi:predicted PurR-regulated permease PerM
MKKPTWLLYLGIAALLIYIAYLVRSTLTILLIGYLLYKILDPMVESVQKKIKNRALAIGLIFIGILAVFGLILNLIIPSLIRDLNSVIASREQIQTQITNWIQQNIVHHPLLQSEFIEKLNIQPETLLQKFSAWVSTQLIVLSGQLLNFGSAILSSVSQFFIALIFTIYLLLDKEKIQKTMSAFIPTKRKKIILEIIELFNSTIIRYLRSLFLLSLIIFICEWIGFSLLGVPYPLLFALWAGLMEFIPMIGFTLGMLPPILIMLFTPVGFVMTLIFLLILQFVEGNFLSPKIMNRSTGLHPLVILTALLMGSNLAGIIGMITAIPLATILIALINRLKKYLVKL